MCYQKTSEDELENGLEISHTASLPYPVSSLCCSFLLMDCIKGNTKQGSFLHHHKWNKLPQVILKRLAGHARSREVKLRGSFIL